MHDVEIGKSPVSVFVCACVFSISVTSLLLRSKSEYDAAHSRASLEGVGGVGRTPNTVCAPTFFFIQVSRELALLVLTCNMSTFRDGSVTQRCKDLKSEGDLIEFTNSESTEGSLANLIIKLN